MSGNFLSNFEVIYSSGTLESNHSKISKVPRYKKNKQTNKQKPGKINHSPGMSGNDIWLKCLAVTCPLKLDGDMLPSWFGISKKFKEQRIHISQEIANIFTKTFKRSYKDCQRCLSFKDRKSSKTFINILKRSLLCSSHKWNNRYL